MGFQAVTLTRSYEQVVEQIQVEIRRGALAPGQRLPTERELAESFGVSRAVIREALKVLAAMGLVEARQGSGTYVRANPVPSITRALVLSATPAEESLLALFELREPLEALAARLAAGRRTDEEVERIAAAAADSRRAALDDDRYRFATADAELHGAIFEAAGNPYLTNVASAVRELLSRALLQVVTLTGTMTAAAEHHVGIGEAIGRGDAGAAGELMAVHIRYNADALREMLADGHEIGPPGRWTVGVGGSRTEPAGAAAESGSRVGQDGERRPFPA